MVDVGIDKTSDSDQALLRRMELLEQRILSPPIRNNKPIHALLPGEEKGLDEIVYIHQNSGSQHSFSFEKPLTVSLAQAGSPSQSHSHSLQQAHQLVDDHLRVISKKLLISTTAETHDAEGHENIQSTTELSNRPLSSNSFPSSVSATIMSYPSITSNETLITAHLDRRSTNNLSNQHPIPTTKPLFPNALPSSSRSILPRSETGVGGVNESTMDVNTYFVGNNANKRKSFIPTKRVLTSIVDLCTQPEEKKKRVAEGDKSNCESRSVSPNVAVPENPVSDHPKNNKRVSIDNVNDPILIIDNAATDITAEQGQSSRGSLSNPPFQASSAHTAKKTSTKATTSNNSVITAFFQKASNKSNVKASSGNEISCAKPVTVNTEINASINLTVPVSHGSTSSRDTDTTVIQSLKNENSSLKAEISSLQTLLRDKMDQLNAVSNNQTIVHAHLKAQMLQCEKNIVNLQDELKMRNSQTADVIESLIRKQSMREVVDLRQQLASDGARLGRLVFNRVGMHSVESWEDGLISKSLKKRKDELRRKKLTLLKQKSDQSIDEVEENSELLEFSDMDIQSESIEMQIKEIHRQELMIEKDEDSLYLEKASHIKALKRLACEDASRFNSRPKVNAIIFLCNKYLCIIFIYSRFIIFFGSFMTDISPCHCWVKEVSQKFGWRTI